MEPDKIDLEAVKMKPLDIEALRRYQEQNPRKFKMKFGDLDLDNLPEGFDIDLHKRNIVLGLPKTPLMNEINSIENANLKEEIANLKKMLEEKGITKEEADINIIDKVNLEGATNVKPKKASSVGGEKEEDK